MASDRRHMRELGKLGGLAKAAKRRSARQPVEPYGEPFLAFVDAVGRGGPSRATWRVFWLAADGLPLSDAELVVFRRHTARQHAPTAPARECWIPAGRRAGKSENAIERATWRAISRQWTAQLAAGEVGTLPVIASDRAQARNSLGYLKGLAAHPVVKPYVATVLKDSVEFRTGAVVQVVSASFRAVRGYTMLDAVLEESAFYAQEDSANPDEEILIALRPAMLTVPDARVYGISSPYARRGILWTAYEQHWGKDDDDVLVFNADTLSLNPTVSPKVIERAFADDPIAAASEYGRDGLVSFRQDVEAFLSRESVQAVVVPNRRELAPRDGVRYTAHVDPSGGSQDSYTVAIAHHETRGAVGMVVLDCVRETRPPFSPESVTTDYAKLLAAYHVSTVTGDKYAGEFPRELFRKAGVEYRPAELTTSDYYRECLPLVNAARVELLDHPRVVAQLAGLERHVGRTGHDTISHPPGGHDDLAAVVAGVAVRAAGQRDGPVVAPIQVLGASRWGGVIDRPQEVVDWQDPALPRPPGRGRFDF
jgi:hypothetical protein